VLAKREFNLVNAFYRKVCVCVQVWKYCFQIRFLIPPRSLSPPPQKKTHTEEQGSLCPCLDGRADELDQGNSQSKPKTGPVLGPPQQIKMAGSV